MKQQTLIYVAVVVSMLYGVGFMIAGSHTGAYASIGGVVCAAVWMGVAMLGRSNRDGHRS